MCVFTSNEAFFSRHCIYRPFEVEKEVLHKESLISRKGKKTFFFLPNIHRLTFLSQERKEKKDKMKEQNSGRSRSFTFKLCKPPPATRQ